MSYLRKNRLWAGMILFLAVAYNSYYVFLMQAALWPLVYLDVLLGVLLLAVIGTDAYQYYKWKAHKKSLMRCAYVICHELGQELGQGQKQDEGLDVAEHDVRFLEGQLREQFDMNCGLQDYIAKWCHEVKLPLSASLLMNEKINDAALRTAQKEQLETIRQRLNGALLGCKVQGSLFDLDICAVNLAECVRTAIHNNQYFLIQNRFEISVQVEPADVYSDKSWLVYVLDQLIQNSMKYAAKNPVLKIQGVRKEDGIELSVWDNGEGILESDIRRIFERGYTGSNHHNGKYKSTGMGLYMVAQILGRLGHAITVESVYGVYTRFGILMKAAGNTVRKLKSEQKQPQYIDVKGNGNYKIMWPENSRKEFPDSLGEVGRGVAAL